jgi:hypothetical protein
VKALGFSSLLIVNGVIIIINYVLVVEVGSMQL